MLSGYATAEHGETDYGNESMDKQVSKSMAIYETTGCEGANCVTAAYEILKSIGYDGLKLTRHITPQEMFEQCKMFEQEKGRMALLDGGPVIEEI